MMNGGYGMFYDYKLVCVLCRKPALANIPIIRRIYFEEDRIGHQPANVVERWHR
jgi:hypothetical protein